MARSGLYVDCCRILRKIQHKGSLKYLFQNSSLFTMKRADFMTHAHYVFFFYFKERKINERNDQIFHTATMCPFSYKVAFLLVESAFFYKYALLVLKRNVNTKI